MQRSILAILAVVLTGLSPFAIAVGAETPPATAAARTTIAKLTKQVLQLLDEPPSAELLRLAERIEELTRGTAAPQSQERARSALLMARVRTARDEYALAEQQLEQAQAMASVVAGRQSQLWADIVNEYGYLWYVRNEYAKADALYQEAIQVMRSQASVDEFQLARLLCAAGLNYTRMGLLNEAQAALEESLRLYKKAHLTQTSDAIDCLRNMGLLYSYKEQPKESLLYYEQALQASDDKSGPFSLSSAGILANIGTAAWDLGDADRAVSSLDRALKIREQLLGSAHRDVASTLNNLGFIYAQQGDYARAYSLHLRAKEIYSRVLGPKKYAVGVTLLHLANIHNDQGQIEQAGPLLEQSLSILNEQATPENRIRVSANISYGNYLLRMGRPEQAAAILRPLLARGRAMAPAGNTQIAAILINLAGVHLIQGDPARAEPMLRDALAMEERAYGRDNFAIVPTLNELAYALKLVGRVAESRQLLWRCLQSTERFMHRARLRTSINAFDALLVQMHAVENAIYSLAAEHPEDRETRALAWNAALLYKGRSLEETIGMAARIRKTANSPQLAAQLGELSDLYDQISQQHAGTSSDADARHLAELLRRAELLDEQLVQAAALPSDSRQSIQAGELTSRVAARLGPNSALFELVLYQPPQQHAIGGVLRYGPMHVLGLTMDAAGTSSVVELGDAERLYAAVGTLRAALSHWDGHPEAASRQLYELLIAPFERSLAAQRIWYFAPDGPFSLVPISVLAGARGLVLDGHEVIYLNSGRDLLREWPKVQASARPALAVYANPTAAGGQYPALAYSEQEALTLQSMFSRIEVHLRGDATAQALFHSQSPTVLHIATHGIYKDAERPPESARGMVLLADTRPWPEMNDIRQQLVQTGIVLATEPSASVPATAAAPAKGSPGELSSVIVTALQLSTLDLSGTRMVVLSTCNSGLGELFRGQGVYGLQRAFLHAGAETVVTSLWSVNDQATEQLMAAFYRELAKGATRAAAMRTAARATREHYPHPYYWASFIITGSGSAIPELTF